jgi:hypothetical protein
MLSLGAHAALPDEIQVYASDIDKPGEPPARGWRLPELSYGLTRTLEAGLYLPFVHGAGGRDERWLLAFNPILGFDLAVPERGRPARLPSRGQDRAWRDAGDSRWARNITGSSAK